MRVKVYDGLKGTVKVRSKRLSVVFPDLLVGECWRNRGLGPPSSNSMRKE